MFDWQTLAAAISVIIAAAYVLRALILTLTARKGNDCGSSCSGCGPATTGVKEVQLVSLDIAPTECES